MSRLLAQILGWRLPALISVDRSLHGAYFSASDLNLLVIPAPDVSPSQLSLPARLPHPTSLTRLRSAPLPVHSVSLVLCVYPPLSRVPRIDCLPQIQRPHLLSCYSSCGLSCGSPGVGTFSLPQLSPSDFARALLSTRPSLNGSMARSALTSPRWCAAPMAWLVLSKPSPMPFSCSVV